MSTPLAKAVHWLFRSTIRGVNRRALATISFNVPETKKSTESRRIRHLIKNVQKQDGENMVKIDWNDGNRHRFPFVFLRDNCQCSVCFNAQTKQRLCDILKITQMDYETSKITVTEAGDKLQVNWPDGHFSEFQSDWLRERVIPESIHDTKGLVEKECVLWGSEMNGSIPAVEFSQMMEKDEALFHWLDSVRRYGVALVTGTPKELGQLQVIGERVGVLKSTLYGPTSIVQSRKQPFNIAFTNADFGCHTDMSFYEQTGGIELFHCIAQVAKGGETILVDGFNIAKQLHDNHHELFSTLCGMLLPFHERNVFNDDFIEFDHHNWTAPFQLDPYGKIKRFCYNEASRDSYLHVPLPDVDKFYAAYAKLTELIRDPKNSITYKMRAGDIITANNLRVMHGRKSFELGKDDKRVLEVGFIDWDVGFSKMRLLANKLGLGVRRSTPYTTFL